MFKLALFIAFLLMSMKAHPHAIVQGSGNSGDGGDCISKYLGVKKVFSTISKLDHLADILRLARVHITTTPNT